MGFARLILTGRGQFGADRMNIPTLMEMIPCATSVLFGSTVWAGLCEMHTGFVSVALVLQYRGGHLTFLE